MSLLLFLISVLVTRVACSVAHAADRNISSRSLRGNLVHSSHPSISTANRSIYEIARDEAKRSDFRVSFLGNEYPNRSGTLRVGPPQAGYSLALGLGTPTDYFSFVLEPRSNVSWLPCIPREKPGSFSYSFEYLNSKSFKSSVCDSTLTCKGLPSHIKCAAPGEPCPFELRNGGMNDISVSGFYVSDTFKMIVLPRGTGILPIGPISFACANQATTVNSHHQGVVALNRDSFSFTTQLADYHNVDNIFAYCFLTLDSTASSDFTPMFFGAAAGDLVTKGSPTLAMLPGEYHSVKMRIIEFGNFEKQIDMSATVATFDAGSFLTYIPSIAYDKLSLYFSTFCEESTGENPIKVFQKNQDPFMCINPQQLKRPGFNLPNLAFVFTEDIILTIKPENYMFYMLANTYCLGIRATPESLGNTMLIGSISQQNFLMVFENVENKIFVEPQVCKGWNPF